MTNNLTTKRAAPGTGQSKGATWARTHHEKSWARYRKLIEQTGHIPADAIVANLLGIKLAQAAVMRRQAGKQYAITETKVEGVPEDIGIFYKLGPKADPMVERITTLAKNMSEEDRKTLVELLSMQNGHK